MLVTAAVALAAQGAAAHAASDPVGHSAAHRREAHGRKARPQPARKPEAAAVPLPLPKPEAKPATSDAAPETQAGVSGKPEEADEQACEARLKQDGVGFEALPPLSGPLGCGAAAPLRVSALAPGVAVPDPTLTCPMAEALANWLTGAVIPAAEAQFGTKPVTVLTGTSYECRPRDHQPGAKLSEHGHANAVDIAGFRLADKRVIEIAGHPDPDSPEGRFLAEIRAGACSYFHTVLGPGSDEAHSSHFHLDMAPRHHDYRICQ